MLNERLKELREDAGLSQKELADKLNVARTTIASYETGKSSLSIEILIRYADFFNTTCDYLVGRTNCKDYKITSSNEIEFIHNKNVAIDNNNNEAISLLKKALDKLIDEQSKE
ncbi:helix-turn-helix transcriptional regulator [Clostridium sp. D53t1_180928_C8]|uniref:helix-turn-helix domain-containing protein n=1 Tax=Clostridium sp. D53t1_180928_C8 TaxID=2787101 RepID=UPI0018AAA506|nr:helix-turn-helix transcriptional regulator [Clostridium sp. D53t1_180928_C8]